jgi:hypothetical protein
MTLASLDAWAAAPGQREAEKQQRAHVVKKLTTNHFLRSRKLRPLKDLNLDDQNHLTSLPDGITVSRNLSLSCCGSLRSLPAGLSVGNCLDLSYCNSLTHLPEGLAISGYCSLRSCSSLTHLPDEFVVMGGLDMGDCSALIQLPTELNVGGHLDLSDCSSLRRLGERSSVGGNLILTRCSSLTHLPEDLLLSASTRSEFLLSVRDCRSLTGLPDCVVTHLKYNDRGNYYLDSVGSRISLGAVERNCARIDATAAEFIRRAQRESVWDDAQEVDDGTEADGASTPPAAAIGFWRALVSSASGRDHLDEAAVQDLHANPQQLTSLVKFLNRLRETAEYKNLYSRPQFAQRVVDLIAQIAASEDLAAVCHERIGEALESCGDRVSWAMNQLELAVRVHQAEKKASPEQELRALGRSLLRLQVVHQHAAAKVERLRKADSIEVYLAFESRLTVPLRLPLRTTDMLYERTADVSRAELGAATKAAQKADADPRQVEDFLASWQPWQNFLRRQQAAACTWQGLPALPQGARVDGTEVCVLTQESVADLQAGGGQVAAMQDPRGQWEPYDYKKLLQWWVQRGTHPVLGTSMQLESFHRVEVPAALPD